MSATAAVSPIAIGRTLLLLTALFGAGALHAQTSGAQGSTSIFDQLKKASDDVTTLLKPASKTKGDAASASAAASAEVNGFAFVLNGCENIQGSGVTCHFHATNKEADRALQIAGGAGSYIIDADGGQHATQSLRLGTGPGTTMTTTNVPVEGVIAFGVVDSGVKKIAELHLKVTGGQFDWRNVPLQSPQVEASVGADAASTPVAEAPRPRAIEVASTSSSAAHGPHLTNDDVVKLLKVGLAEPTIVQMIDGSSPAFDTSANGLIALKQAGASDTIIQHIFTRQQTQTQAN